ncbi:MAG: NADH-quinone oxidoreductase subunit NuoH [Acidobacteria bacterium]|nr:NADH-quinone oxidoreductase subunit NuoH [Acidobacteriota bacterium]MBV9474739.1 NADH-quinone oxidoreductase subunit NuoH [Acidobacteriota bacterium]
MGHAFDATDITLSIVKIAIVLIMMLQITPIMVWVERRGSALIQDRPGPNRVGPLGLLQSFADALKFILKEDIIPSGAHKWLYTLAPALGLFPALTTIAVVPWGRGFLLHERLFLGRRLFAGGRWFEPVVADVSVGLLVVFALASLSVYGITTAGWASNNKYSLFGGIRASAQMISYELSLTLAAVSALLVAGSLRLTDVVWQQTGSFVLFNTIKLPAWNVFSPAMWLSFIIFTVSGFAETNRLPFDFAEAEAELVAGYHTEYSSMKFALFFMSEYMAMGTMSALITTLYLGGWDIPWYHEPPTFLGFILSALCFLAKVSFLMFVFVWVRWTIPRLKYDILMRIGWKIFLPLAFLNIVLVAAFIAAGWI